MLLISRGHNSTKMGAGERPKRETKPRHMDDFACNSSMPGVYVESLKKKKERKRAEIRQNPEILYCDKGEAGWDPYDPNHVGQTYDMQFHTDRLSAWKEAVSKDLKDRHDRGELSHEPELISVKRNPQVRVKSNDGSKWSVTVKLYNSGTVLVQGKDYIEWCKYNFPFIKAALDLQPELRRINPSKVTMEVEMS